MVIIEELLNILKVLQCLRGVDVFSSIPKCIWSNLKFQAQFSAEPATSNAILVSFRTSCNTQATLTVDDAGATRVFFHLQMSLGLETTASHDKSSRWQKDSESGEDDAN